jgi:hypothetical protein
MTVSILRDGAPLDLQVTPEKRGEIGWLGIVLADATKSIKPGFVDHIRLSVSKNVQHRSSSRPCGASSRGRPVRSS